MNPNRARLVPGLALIVVGLVLLLMQFYEFGPGHVLIILGLVLLATYLFIRNDALLIPGPILSGLGLGILFGRAPFREDVMMLLGLGCGFLAIYTVRRILVGYSHWWPLVPGGILVLLGVVESLPQGQLLIERGWPILLIAIGLGLLTRQYWQPDADRRSNLH